MFETDFSQNERECVIRLVKTLFKKTKYGATISTAWITPKAQFQNIIFNDLCTVEAEPIKIIVVKNL